MKMPSQNELDTSMQAIAFYKSEMDRIQSYISLHPWDTLENEAERVKEFKVHNDLLKAYEQRLEKYNKLTGLIDAYNKLKQVKTTYRKGQSPSGVEQRVKERIEARNQNPT